MNQISFYINHSKYLYDLINILHKNDVHILMFSFYLLEVHLSKLNIKFLNPHIVDKILIFNLDFKIIFIHLFLYLLFWIVINLINIIQFL